MRKGKDGGGIYLLVFKTKFRAVCRPLSGLVWGTLGIGKREEPRRLFGSKGKARLGLLPSVFSLTENDRATWLPRSGGVPPGGARRPLPQPARSRTSTSALGRSCRN